MCLASPTGSALTKRRSGDRHVFAFFRLTIAQRFNAGKIGKKKKKKNGAKIRRFWDRRGSGEVGVAVGCAKGITGRDAT